MQLNILKALDCKQKMEKKMIAFRYYMIPVNCINNLTLRVKSNTRLISLDFRSSQDKSCISLLKCIQQVFKLNAEDSMTSDIV